jgi:hypothetical protein
MQISALFQKYGRDLFYICIIIGLLAWIWRNECQAIAWSEIIEQDLVSTKQVVSHHNEGVFYEIEQNIADNERENIRAYKLELRLAKNAVDQFKNKTTRLMASLWASPPGEASELKRPLEKGELAELCSDITRLRDSLLTYVNQEPITAGMINQVLGLDPTGAYWSVAQGLKTKDTDLFLQDLILRGELAYTVTLAYVSDKTYAPTGCFNWQPMVYTDKSTILPGQTYSADIFLSQYTKSNSYKRNVTIKVNGKTISLKDGLARYNQQYHTTGEKKFAVRIEVKNPTTNQMEVFQKDFSLWVIDSCQ